MTQPTIDKWDGKQHKAEMCVACIVSGWVSSAPHVTTSCGLFIETMTQQNPKLPRCRKCSKAPDPDNCGFCGLPTNKKWKT